MDFSTITLSPAQEAFRDELREFLDSHLTEEVYARDRERKDNFDEDFYLALGSRGWLTPEWPKSEGGADLDEVCSVHLEQELERRRAPDYAAGTTRLVWIAVAQCGDPVLREELKPRVASGTARFCLGYTEPEGGSDIAAARTRAVRDGNDWIINGSKMFTTGAHYSQYVFLLVRTDSSLPKHRGLTMFLVPLNSDGVDIQPLHTLGDERTNITYYNDVRVSDRYRIGEVNNGWAVLHGPLDAEHSIGGDSMSVGATHMRPLYEALEATARWANENQASGGSTDDDPLFRSTLGRIIVHAEAGLATPGPMGRVKCTETAVSGARQLVDLVGPVAMLPFGTEGAVGDGEIEFAHRHAQATTIYGGSVEVFRSLIAESILKLPRPDFPGRKNL